MSCYDILQAVDPIPRITCCPLDNPAHAQQLCPLHERLDAAAALIEMSFRESTVADMTVRPVFTVPAPGPGEAAGEDASSGAEHGPGIV
jgi:hypothetical protein